MPNACLHEGEPKDPALRLESGENMDKQCPEWRFPGVRSKGTGGDVNA